MLSQNRCHEMQSKRAVSMLSILPCKRQPCYLIIPVAQLPLYSSLPSCQLLPLRRESLSPPSSMPIGTKTKTGVASPWLITVPVTPATRAPPVIMLHSMRFHYTCLMGSAGLFSSASRCRRKALLCLRNVGGQGSLTLSLSSVCMLGPGVWLALFPVSSAFLRRCRASLPSLYGSPPLSGVLCIVRIDSKAYSLNILLRPSFPIVAGHVTPKSNY